VIFTVVFMSNSFVRSFPECAGFKANNGFA